MELIGRIAAVCLLFALHTVHADVTPPIDLMVDQIGTDPTSGRIDLRIAVRIPDYGTNPEAEIRLAVHGEGAIRLAGDDHWTVDAVVPGQTYAFSTTAFITSSDPGHLTVTAATLDSNGRDLWGKAEDIYFKKTAASLLSSHGSPFEVERGYLDEQRARGVINDKAYWRGLRKMTESVTQLSQAGTAAVAPAAVFDMVAVSGTAKYTQRTNVSAAGVNTFAAAADALAIRGASVEFYDDNGTTQTLLATTPAAVTTDSTGAYSATVPGKRPDGTPVQLVVKISANSPAAKIGPIGIGGDPTLAYKAVSSPLTLDSAAKTVDVLVDNSNLTVLGAFSIRDGIETAYDFVNANDASTGVGVNPLTIYIEYPGNNANGSFFSTSGGDHLNIGLNHGFDWDVYTHEYGHYVQKLNATTQNPGGTHYICGSATGLVQTSPARTLTKDQGIKLAWGEGWPTFFGTNLQIASGAGAFGIFGVGDTVYTDTANKFHYDLEANSDLCAGAGEDSELSVQRILWDFADQPQDGHDSVTFGTDAMWKELNGGSKPVTLDQFRSLFDGLVPSSPAGYSTGTLNQNRMKYGRIYADHNVGPVPLTPAENYASATTPQFSWSTKGAGGAPSYHFNKFNVVFYDKDFINIIFTSPEIPTAVGALATDGLSASWTPTAAEWTTITTGDTLIHWVVQGIGDSPAPSTGPYYGLDRTIGGLSIAFVIDDTGSMSEDIAGVRNGLTNFITQLRAMTPPVKPLIEVITFKDYVTRRTVSDDLDQIQSVVNSLTATGGGDCPESSAEALLEAASDLPSSGSGSTIIFATDASPHAGYSLAGIESQIRAKGIAITELLTGDCAPDGGVTPTISAAAMAVSAALEVTQPSPSASENWDPDYVQPAIAGDSPTWPEDVICPDTCPVEIGAGPAMSPNILKLVGDFSLPIPSSVASFAGIANASTKGTLLFLPEVKSGDTTAYSNALTNAALGAVTAAVISVSPSVGYPDSTMDVVITGGNTNFDAGSTVSFSGGDITVNGVTPISATKLQATITIPADAISGARDVVVTTPLGPGVVETTTGTGQFGVETSTVPLLASILPEQVALDSTRTIEVYGVGTHFDSTSIVSIAANGVTVGAVTVESATKLKVELTVAPSAPLGFHAFTVTTGSETANFGGGLLIVESLTPPPALPVLTSVSPSSGAQGASALDIAVVGANTHFIDGETIATLSGDGITVISTTVTSPTDATVRIAISPTAALGFRDLILTTSGETAVAVSGFQVLPGIVDTTPPAIVIDTAPTTLWPPNNKMVEVTISGSVTDNEPGGTGVNPSTVAYAVTDEYGEVQPRGSVALMPDGSYSFTIKLWASRKGSDIDGRLYTIVVSAQDNNGNKGSSAAQVIVPHDERH